MQKSAGLMVLVATIVFAAGGKKAHAAADPIMVQAISVESIKSSEVAYLTGEIRARIQSELSFRVGGRIVERLVEVGDAVKAGELLARLDAEEQKAEIAVAEANLQSAHARQRLAELALDRQQNLLKTRVTTLAALDQAKEDVATSKEEVVAAGAQLDNARREFSFTDLRADADGVITARTAEVGQVAKATQPIFTLAKNGPRDGIFEVQEAIFLRNQLQPHMFLSLISAPDRKFYGEVREVSPTIDGFAGTIKLKVNIGSDLTLPLGAPIVGEFITNQRVVMEVPWSAMSVDGRVAAVWVINPTDMTASLREIKIGSHSTTAVEIASGLSVGELVVVEGGKFLSPGRVVTLTGEAKGGTQ
ncbi:efflux RND transporter periplasmic adaptor subunit [Endobacterium cereale]|uniref:efflux RND transporter periplasmic adaptor subunit n=1 Tax=Endobacterium cereale TaxID=2663029 RepID=UPI002B476C1C|nr:efflux RND transporter periplasmic adaptor subunit [Endobacterium cereale]MEB2848044.1 efflux RND transporter periplasmic adaptor subunit [Endobacterium cereale]